MSTTTEAPLYAFTSTDRSEKIGELVGALAIAQSEIRAAEKDRENPFYKSSYSTLASVWAACRDHLGKNGIAVIQVPQLEGPSLYLYTWLAHKSGEWMRSRYPVNAVKNDPQGIGSAVTYARRYSLAAMVGVYSADEDDDGESAMGRDSKPAPKPAARMQKASDAVGTITGDGPSAAKPVESKPPEGETKPALATLKAELDAAREARDLAAIKVIAGKIAKQPKNIQQALIPVYNAAKNEVESATKSNGASGKGSAEVIV